jgi:hypothetical protein
MSTRRTFLDGAAAAATTLPLAATARVDAAPRTGKVQTVPGFDCNGAWIAAPLPCR